MTPKLTSAGRNILLRALAGETINFTKVQLGNGPAQPPETATGLQNPLLTAVITDIDIGDGDDAGYAILTATLNNESVSTGFHITEAGFFVEDPDDDTQEILYAIGNEDESSADFVPSSSSRILEMQYDMFIYIGDAENVTAAISSSLVYATKEALDTHTAARNNPHQVTAAQVGLGNVPNKATNDQTPTYNEAATLADLTSGETLSTAFGKIKKAVSSLISHLSLKNNPHNVTAAQAGAAPSNHTHAASAINSGTLAPARGGTGLSSPTSGGLLKGKGDDPVELVTGTGALYSETAGNPQFGTLPIAMGGTGQTTLAALAAALSTQGGFSLAVAGTYTGNGQYGSSHKNILTFDKIPKLLVVMPQSNNSYASRGGFIAVQGTTLLRAGGLYDDVADQETELHLTWGANSVSWYSATSVTYQRNESGCVYSYFAIL